MAEPKILRLTCPVCESRLRVTEGTEHFACLNCGTELKLEKTGGVARLVPTKASQTEMSEAQQRLVEVNANLKTTDDRFGVGCAVVTMGITLVACIGLGLAVIVQSQILFWGTLGVALVLLAGVLFVFTTASSRDTDPLLRQRDALQAQIEQETAQAEPPSSDSTDSDQNDQPTQASGA